MDNRSTLYKYLDIQGAKLLLAYGRLKFTNSTQFDDPFDCHPSLIDCSNVPPEKCGSWPPEIIKEIEENRYERLRDDTWICSLSKVCDSLLMWSYYTKHNGVCVGFSRKHLSNSFHGWEGLATYSHGFDVQYKDIIDKPDGFRYPDIISYQMCTKARAWEHEQEVRLFIVKPSPRIMMLLPGQNDKDGPIDWKAVRAFPCINNECFESVYLGIKVSPKDRDQIIELAKERNPNIRLYQMRVDEKSFHLIPELIEE